MTVDCHDASIIIVHYGDEKLTYNCVRSVLKSENIDRIEVIVINNGPQNTLDLIRRTSPLIRIVDAKKNIGYVGATNLGCSLARGSLLVVLNNDVVVERNCIEKLILCLEENSQVGFCAPIKHNMDNPALLDGAGGAMNVLLQTWDLGNFEFAAEEFTYPKEILYPPGAAYAVRKEIASIYGSLLDDDFFMYFDDPDIGTRSFFAGYTGLLIPSARVFHKRSAASERHSSFSYFYLSRNMLIFIFKNFDSSTFLKLLLNYVASLVFRISNVMFVLKGKAGKQVVCIVAGAFSGLSMLRSAKNKKARVQSVKKRGGKTDCEFFELLSDEAIFFSEEPPPDWLIKSMTLAIRVITAYSKFTHIFKRGISRIIIVCKGKRRIYSLK